MRPVLSIHATRNYVLKALQAGASEYLLKDSAFEDLSAALAAAGKRRMYLSPAIDNADALNREAGHAQGKKVVDVQLTDESLKSCN